MVRPRTMKNARAGRLEEAPRGSSDEEDSDEAAQRKHAQHCPLCMTTYDVTDLSFTPCVCSYKVCLWCVHRLRTENKGCPACRRPYDSKLLDANPRPVRPEKSKDVNVSGAHFFAAIDPAENCSLAPRAKSVPAKRQQAAVDGIPVGLPDGPAAPAPLHRSPSGQDEDPWTSAHADPWATAAAQSRPVQAAAPEPKLDWWAAHVAQVAEDSAAPWLPPEQGKASRDFFSPTGLSTRALSRIGPSRADDLESWMAKRKSSRPRASARTPGRRASSSSGPSAGRRVSRAASEPSNDVVPASKSRSYAGVLLAESPAQEPTPQEEREPVEVHDLEGPPGSEGFFVTREGRRRPAVPHGFGPDAPSEPHASSPAVPSEIAVDEFAQIRVRARLALRDAMAGEGVEAVRRRLANAVAAGVSSVLTDAAGARLAELMSAESGDSNGIASVALAGLVDGSPDCEDSADIGREFAGGQERVVGEPVVSPSAHWTWTYTRDDWSCWDERTDSWERASCWRSEWPRQQWGWQEA